METYLHSSSTVLASISIVKSESGRRCEGRNGSISQKVSDFSDSMLSWTLYSGFRFNDSFISCFGGLFGSIFDGEKGPEDNVVSGKEMQELKIRKKHTEWVRDSEC